MMMRLEYRAADVELSWESDEVALGTDIKPYLEVWRRAVEFAHELFSADARAEREVARLAAGILPQREPEAPRPAPAVFACPGCGDEVVAARTYDGTFAYFDAEPDPDGQWHLATGRGDGGEDLATVLDADTREEHLRQGRPLRTSHLCPRRD